MSIQDELRARYRKGDSWRELFDMLTTYTNRVKSTSAKVASDYADLTYDEAVARFKDLASLGIGTFKYGRHGAPTRIEWAYSPLSVGQVAQGKTKELDSYELLEESDLPSQPLSDAIADVEGSSETASASPRGYAEIITAAKTALARQLKIEPEQIEITIKH